MSMEKIIDNAIESRAGIKDFETVLSLMWIDAANMDDTDKADATLEALLRTA